MKTLEILQNNAISKQDMNHLKGGTSGGYTAPRVKCDFYDVSVLGKRTYLNSGYASEGANLYTAQLQLNNTYNTMDIDVVCTYV